MLGRERSRDSEPQEEEGSGTFAVPEPPSAFWLLTSDLSSLLAFQESKLKGCAVTVIRLGP
jgi:hypothetical protein